jgi:O-glycosyl hydrolase
VSCSVDEMGVANFQQSRGHPDRATIANGAIVFATPWNAAGARSSSKFASYATPLRLVSLRCATTC